MERQVETLPHFMSDMAETRQIRTEKTNIKYKS